MAKLVKDPNALTQVILMLGQNDTEIIKRGEELLKPFLKLTGSVSALINLIVSHPDAGVKLQSAIQLKRKIGVLFPKFNETDKLGIRNQLFGILTSVQEKPVGIAIAGAIAAIAKSVIKDKKDFPELFQTFMALAQQPDERLRFLNYSLFAQVLFLQIELFWIQI